MAIKRKNQKNKPEEPPVNQSRRDLLKSAGIVGAAAVGSAAAGNVIAADSNPQSQITSPIPAREALEVLTAEEADTLEAICDCQKVELTASARMEGDLSTARLEVAEGAVLVGRCMVGVNGHAKSAKSANNDKTKTPGAPQQEAKGKPNAPAVAGARR